MWLFLVMILLFSFLACFFLNACTDFNRFSNSSYDDITLSYSFILLFVFYHFFLFFFSICMLSSTFRACFPDLGNGSTECIWYNRGYERHLLSTSQPYRVNVNDSQLLCALRRCYYWYNRGISSCNEKEKIPGFARLPFYSFLSSIV